jgi:hypothetical protein
MEKIPFLWYFLPEKIEYFCRIIIYRKTLRGYRYTSEIYSGEILGKYVSGRCFGDALNGKV